MSVYSRLSNEDSCEIIQHVASEDMATTYRR